MDNKNQAFLELENLFSSHGYHLFLVGGTVRDILLNIPLTDMDVVTDATPEQMKEFINGDYTFSKMGSVKCKINDVKFDITTLREEEKYDDYRHPKKIHFVTSLKKDHVRRDFTINAMYMDKHFQLIDFENGLEDLNNGVIRMVGNPKKRLKEDPLRILRAIRFALTYDFSLDESLEKALIQSVKYLDFIQKDKIKQEIKKMNSIPKDKVIKIFDKYSIKDYQNMIE